MQHNKNPHILVVSRTPELAETARRAVEGAGEVDYAPTEAAALEKIGEKHPEIVVLGPLESEEAVQKFYRELQEGWVSRHSSLLTVEATPSADAYRILDDNPASPFISAEALLPGLKIKIDEKLKGRASRFRSSIMNPKGFCLTWEQIPGRGAFEARQELVLENARKAARGGKVCAISITDNPGGNPAIATDVLCSEVRKLGVDPLVHIAFRDKNRNQVESLLFQLAALDINNLLVLTGDYPSNSGFEGKSKPVFDLDSVNGLQLISEMNRGIEYEIMRKKTKLAPTNFFSGVAFSPFKQEEAEVMGQYYKLKKKIEAGTDFIVTQVGYDARKLDELRLWLKSNNYKVPVLTNIYILPYAAAKVMHDNRVPGCVVTDKLLAKIEEESKLPDKGRQARLDRAAKMYAIARGMCFSGVSISGQGVPYESVEYVINKGKELLPTWQDLLPEFDYPQENGFYYFEKDLKNGLNLETRAPKKQKAARPVIWYMSRALHVVVFEPKSPFFKIMRQVARWVDSSRIPRQVFGSVEYWIKAGLYGCMNCGDCALFDVAYICPVSQCPKNQRNGPCGGSFQGWCEVYPNERKCIWVRGYRRLRASNREDSIGETIVPPCNWELWQTSSWLNYFTGRDHVSKRMGIKVIPRKQETKK